MVKCYRCGEDKPPSEFYKAKNMSHREDCHSYCKSCQKKYVIAGIKRRRQEGRQAVMEGYGNKCSCCGFDDPRALALDHVNNDGAEERKKWRGRMNFFYAKIIADGFPPNYQILCANCNAIKEYERQQNG